jgi:hypothetical protein
VFVVDVRAGSFPPYYVPDAFLFSPTYGMIPKDSVGEAVTARTAKFTWYAHHAKLRENYARENRRAFAVALARTDARVTVSAWGRPTRGIAAPELLVDLAALRPELTQAVAPRLASADLGTAAVHSAPPVMAADETPARPVVAAERVAEMLHCVRCAPRRTIPASLDAAYTLLSSLAATDGRVEERDVAFAFALGAATVYGRVPGLVRDAGQLYVALTNASGSAAALAITGLRGRVCETDFFIETADGGLRGPHPIDVDEIIGRARAVIAGTLAPLCSEHQNI